MSKLQPTLKSYLKKHTHTAKTQKSTYQVSSIQALNSVFSSIFVDQKWLEGGKHYNDNPKNGPLTGGIFRFVCDEMRLFTVNYDWIKQEVWFGFFLEKFYFIFDVATQTVHCERSLC